MLLDAVSAPPAAAKIVVQLETANPTLTEAVALYKRLKGAGKSETFLRVLISTQN